MRFRNSRHAYGAIAKMLHWTVALLFLGSYTSVYFRHWFTEPKTGPNWTALQLHLSLGITIAVIVGLRVLYRLWDIPPHEMPAPMWQQRAARIVHGLLYAVMIVMPITGYLGTGVATEFLGLFQIPKFPDTGLFATVVQGWMGLSFAEFEKPLDFVHKRGGAYVVWVLIAVHVAGALQHHVVRRDETLRRMLPGATSGEALPGAAGRIT